jgi:hypothetical protein
MKKITNIKSFYLLIACFCVVNFGYGQTTLAEGDIAITGVNLDNNDQFAFVLLTDILNGTTIHFTDTGWQALGDFRGLGPTGTTGEGVVTWTATSDLLCGTVIVIEQTATNIHSATSGTAIESADLGFNLAAAGDQVIAFQGSTSEPTFIYAVHLGSTGGWTDATGGNDSAVPAGLTEGINAINLGNLENIAYDCSITSDQTLILAGIADTSNWTGSNSTRQTLGGCIFSCSAAGSCTSTVTWNGAWVGGTPDLTTAVIIDANYNTNASIGSFKACTLTIKAGATLTVSNSTYIEVENDVQVDGVIYVDTQGNFVQNDVAGVFTLIGAGTASVHKQTAAKNAWYYYTYWSSPVENEIIGNAFPFTDGDRRFSFDAAAFEDLDGDDIDDNDNDWAVALAGDTMLPGVGYIATESRFHIPGGTGTADFTGAFNTRDITAGISHNAANVIASWNLIGNPYPSAIDFIAFQAANSTVVDGVAYFWSQSSPPLSSNPGNEGFNFSQNDYATFTVGTGGAAALAGSPIPSQYIPTAQSFFIAGLANGAATFTNAMRMADGTSNTQFFKSSNTKNNSNSVDNKLWVNLTTDNGVFSQILVGYVDGATNGNDGFSYDAPKLQSDVVATLYSKIEGSSKDFVVQGKETNSLNEDEIINLGFKTSIKIATLYTISIAQLEGAFLTGNTIYLKDNLLNKVHNLSTSDYTFTSEVGEFNERFEIGFNAAALSTNDVLLNKNSLRIVDLEDDRVQFSTSNHLNIKSVRVFDLLGRQLYQFKGNNNTETYRLSNLSNTIFIAKVKLSNGAIITKKAIKK